MEREIKNAVAKTFQCYRGETEGNTGKPRDAQD